MKSRYFTWIRWSAAFLCAALFFSLTACSRQQKEGRAETVSADTVYYSVENLSVYEKKDGETVYVNGVTGDENGIAVLMNTYYYPENPESDDTEAEGYDYVLIVFLDKDGKVINRVNLSELLTDEESWPRSIVKKPDGSFVIITSPSYNDSGISTGEINLYTIDPEAGAVRDKSTVPLGAGREIDTILFGKDDNLYVKGYISDTGMYQPFLAAFDKSGKELFFLEEGAQGSSGWGFGQSMFTDGEKVYIDVYNYSEQESTHDIRVIDLALGQLGDTVPIEGLGSSYRSFQSGNGCFYFTDNSGLYEIDPTQKKVSPFFLWKDMDMEMTADERNAIVLNSDLIFMHMPFWGRMGESRSEYYLLKRAETNPNAGKKIISLGGAYIGWNSSLKQAIYAYNKTSDEYRVEMYDYMDVDEDGGYMDVLHRMNMEILSGEATDIICGDSSLSMNLYISKGLLTDINPLIGADPEFRREDFFENVFSIRQQDGKLYEIFNSFTISGLVGATSLLKDRSGWSIDEFIDMVNSLPENMKPMQDVAYDTLLQMAIMTSDNQFVDWTTGKVNFESDEFKQLLNYAKTYGESSEDMMTTAMGMDMSTEVSLNELIRNKELAMIPQNYMMDLDLFASLWATFGEPISIVGFPSTNKSGPSCTLNTSFSILEKSEHKEEAWKFLKILFTEESQDKLSDNYEGLPVRRSSVDKMIKKVMDPKNFMFGGMSSSSSDGYSYTYENAPLTEEGKEVFLKLVENLNSTMNFDQSVSMIVSEESAGFFEGQKSDSEVARIIQERVQTLVSERS